MDDLDDLVESAGDAAESLGELVESLRELGASSAAPVLGALDYAEPVEPLVAYVSGHCPLERVALDRVEGTVRGPAGAVLARDVEIVDGARQVHRRGWRSLLRLRGREGETIEIEASDLSLEGLAARVHRGAWERVRAELGLEGELALPAAAEVVVHVRELRAGDAVHVHGVLVGEALAADGDGAGAWREPAGGLRRRLAGRFVHRPGDAAGELSAIERGEASEREASEGPRVSFSRAQASIAGVLAGIGLVIVLLAPEWPVWALLAMATTIAAVRAMGRSAVHRVLRVEPRAATGWRRLAARLSGALSVVLALAVGAAPLACAVVEWVSEASAASSTLWAAWIGAGLLASLGLVWLVESGPSLALLGWLARPAQGTERTVEGRVWGAIEELASSAWTATSDVVIESVAGIFLARLEGAVWASARRSGRAVIVGLGDRVLARGRVEDERLGGLAMLCAGDANPWRVLREARARAWIDVGMAMGLSAVLAAVAAWRATWGV
ncbi:MAG: hypothetical protein IT378_23890 [Sandaracinaceae bacterium]|nr:hypothetical protein [Sandaracinaceae bacterium]